MFVSRTGVTDREAAVKASQFAVQNRHILTGKEVLFDQQDVIVSKTDTKGIITYANDIFIGISQYSENELLGAPHSILRHPGMPRCIFRFLWTTIAVGTEVFAYVLNRTKHGNHYWVFAHVTPTVGPGGQITGYHSNRRVPERAAVARIAPLYESLLKVEQSCADKEEGLKKSTQALVDFIAGTGMDYSELVFTL
jgi:PAS domain S-box-containing protein